MSEEMVSKEEHQRVLNKLGVAKDFLRQLDAQVSKYESLDINQKINELELYQKHGSIEEFSKLKSESKVMKKSPTLAGTLLRKVEQDETTQNEALKAITETELEEQIDKEAPEDMNLGEKEKVEENESTEDESKDKDKTDSYDDSEDDDEDEDDDEVDEDASPEVKFEAAQRTLNKYRQLGSLKEIRQVLGKMESLLDSHIETNEKLESYQEIGTIPELIDVCTGYAKIKTKEEAARISTKLNIPVDKVISAIEKTETVGDAETLLTQLFSKNESEEQPKILTPKTESAKDDTIEHGSIVTANKDKTESANLDNLRQVIKKL